MEEEIDGRLNDAKQFLASSSSFSFQASDSLGEHAVGVLKYTALNRIRSLFYGRGIDFKDVASAFPSLYYALTRGIKLCAPLNDERRREVGKLFEMGLNIGPISRVLDIPEGDDLSIEVPVLFSSIGSSSTLSFVRSRCRKVIFPVGLTEVCGSLFSGSSVEEVYVPSSVKRILPAAFSLSRIMRVIFGEGGNYLSIYSMAFKNCPYLNEVVIPRHILRIRADSFYDDPAVCDGVEVDFNRPKLIFQKTRREVLAMDEYPWGIADGRIIRCADGDLVVWGE